MKQTVATVLSREKLMGCQVAMKFSALLEPAEEGGYVIKCVELPVTTEGETKPDALANLKDAIEGYIEIRAEMLRKKSKTKREVVKVSVREASGALLA